MMLLLPPLAAEKMFSIGGFAITNAYINSTIALALFVILAFFVRKGVKFYYAKNKAPKGFLNFFENILELLLSYMDGVTKDRKRTLKILPIVGTLFFFILISNWLGLLPGVGSIGIYQIHGGHVELIPLLRPANTDLNMTVAMAVLAISASHILGIFAIGFFKYANKFIKFGDLYNGIKSFNPIKILIAVIEFFVGLLETVSEFAKVMSLSLRLFGNIFAGEVLLTVMAGLLMALINFGLPLVDGLGMVLVLPFMALEILVGLVQAVVFSMLVLVYTTMATEPVHSHAQSGHGKSHVDIEENQTPAF